MSRVRHSVSSSIAVNFNPKYREILPQERLQNSRFPFFHLIDKAAMSVTLGIEKLEIVQITKGEHQYKILIFSCSRDDGKILHMVDELQFYFWPNSHEKVANVTLSELRI